MLGKPHPSSRARDLFLEVEIPAPGVGRDVVLRGLPVRAEAEGGEGAHRPAGGGGSVPEHGWRRSGRGAEGKRGGKSTAGVGRELGGWARRIMHMETQKGTLPTSLAVPIPYGNKK